MKIYFKVAVILLFCLSVSNSAYSSDITPAMKTSAQEAIKACDKFYNDTKTAGNKLVYVKKPGFLASSSEKKLYNAKLAYEKRMAEFTDFLNKKTKIWTANNAQKFEDEKNTYANTCKTFAIGILGFVQWATTGFNPAMSNVLYEEWLKEVKDK